MPCKCGDQREFSVYLEGPPVRSTECTISVTMMIRAKPGRGRKGPPYFLGRTASAGGSAPREKYKNRRGNHRHLKKLGVNSKNSFERQKTTLGAKGFLCSRKGTALAVHSPEGGGGGGVSVAGGKSKKRQNKKKKQKKKKEKKKKDTKKEKKKAVSFQKGTDLQT